MIDSGRRGLKDFTGIWIPIAVIAITGASILPSSPFLMWMQQAIGEAPSHSPQSYIIKYVARGACAGIGLFVILALSAVTWRRWSSWTRIALCGSLMSLPLSIVYAVALLRRCLLMMDSSQAKTLFYDDTLTDQSFVLGLWAGAASALIVLLLSAISENRRGRSQNREATAGTPNTDSRA